MKYSNNYTSKYPIKPKAAIVTFSIPQEISPISPESRYVIIEYRKRAEEILIKEGLDILNIERFIEDRKATQEVINHLTKENIDSVIFQIGVWPSPSLAIDIINSLNIRIPIILWAFNETRVLSLVPACQFHGAFDDMGIEHEFIYANPEEEKFFKKIKEITIASKAVRDLNGMNLGLFGGRYMNMYTGTADPVQVKKLFGVEIIHINEFSLVEGAKRIDNKKIKEYLEYLHKKYGEISAPFDVEDKSIRLYYAMEKLKEEYDLDFASVKCMLEVQGEYCSHCLSVSKHIDEGFIISCEGDINGALTMQILRLISNSAAGFGDVFEVNPKNKILSVVNCGTFATEFAENPKDVNFPEQMKSLVPGDGTGMTTSFICKPGRVTIARLGRINGEYVMQISTGNALKLSNNNSINKIMPHIFINLDNNDVDFFIQNCRSNHLHWVYGDFKNELIQICKILKIKEIIC
ncbi:MAG: hypothetical protein M1475_02195 [Actinobacteria bacterium]|nr:hypothetical protein [Actinomycetota bacterium]